MAREEEDFEPDSLATRFTILDTNAKKEIARCHLSYRDGSSDPSVGPTIDMIAVHKDYRGKGYLPLLWAHVKKYIKENFTLECMATISEPEHVMIKVQYLTNVIVDHRINSKGNIVKVTDKEFFYQYAGFSVRKLTNIKSKIFYEKHPCRRPKDEEAVLFIPLLSVEDLQKSSSSILLPHHHMKWKLNLGSVACHTCGKVDADQLRCSGCELVYYCSKKCQKSDWKHKHNIWCGKIRDELIPIMIEKGVISQGPDGWEHR